MRTSSEIQNQPEGDVTRLKIITVMKNKSGLCVLCVYQSGIGAASTGIQNWT
jgi:hypothetical protein